MPMPMPMPSPPPRGDADARPGAFPSAAAWGTNPLPPTVLATLIAAQHLRPFRALPMLFPPVLLFSTYLNLQGFKKDSAGLTSAWSMAYFVLARRRTAPVLHKLGARGIVRGATMALCFANAVGGGWAYYSSPREKEDSIV